MRTPCTVFLRIVILLSYNSRLSFCRNTGRINLMAMRYDPSAHAADCSAWIHSTPRMFSFRFIAPRCPRFLFPVKGESIRSGKTFYKPDAGATGCKRPEVWIVRLWRKSFEIAFRRETKEEGKRSWWTVFISFSSHNRLTGRVWRLWKRFIGRRGWRKKTGRFPLF